MLMASRPHLHTSNLDAQNGEEEIMFNPAEHKDLARFFSQVDQSETFALTANEWLGIRSGGEQFNPIGSVGPPPARPNDALTNATRSLMAFNTPVSISPPENLEMRPSSSQDAPLSSASSMTSPVRAWRPNETPFNPSLHGQSNDHSVLRRSSTSSSYHSSHQDRDQSSDAAGHRKRPAPGGHAESLPSKRPRSVSNSHTRPHAYSDSSNPHFASGSSAAASSSTSQPQQKPPLLTAQQKKANHILSEQKRRAKIRRGYDALCEVVPALKSAVMAEQEAADTKKKRGKGKNTDGADLGDGRSGPKSESVVLTQTIDHIEYLVNKKEELLIRLAKAQSALPPGQGGINPEAQAIWEKEWDGGTGVEEGEDDEDDSDDEDTA